MRILSLFMMVFLVSCATQKQVRTLYVAPEIKDYGQEEQKQAAKEIETCKNCSTIVRWIGDYGQLREAIRSVDGTK